MIRKLAQLRDERGAAAIEFAIAVPVLVSMIYGIFQLSLLYFANAGMQHALGEGARFATIFVQPTTTTVATGGETTTSTTPSYPSAADVKARMETELFGDTDGSFTVLDPDTSTPGSYLLRVRYVRKMDFLFLSGPTITLNREKRVYLATT